MWVQDGIILPQPGLKWSQEALTRQPGKCSELIQLYTPGKLEGKEMMDVKSFPVPIIVSLVKCVYQHCMVSQQPRTQEYSLGPGKIATLGGHSTTRKPHQLGVSQDCSTFCRVQRWSSAGVERHPLSGLVLWLICPSVWQISNMWAASVCQGWQTETHLADRE